MAIGALTPWYEAEAGVQKLDINKQVIQENAMKLEEMDRAIKRKREIEELAKQAYLEQQQQGPKGPNSLIQQLPRGFMPGESGGMPDTNKPEMMPVGLQGTTEVPTSPFGTTEQAGQATMGGMQEVPQGFQQPQVQAPQAKQPEESHPLLRQAEIARKTNAEHEALTNSIAQNYNLISKLRERGMVDEANALATTNLGLEQKAITVEKANLEAQDKILDHIGSVATAAADGIANARTPQQAANARAMLIMQAQQLPEMDVSDIMQMSDADLVSTLRQVASSTLSGKEQISLRKKEMDIAAASDRAKKLNEYRKDLLAFRERKQASDRELATDKIKLRERKLTQDEVMDKYKLKIKAWETERSDIEKEIDGYEKSLLELQKGNMFFTVDGKPMSSDEPDVLEREATRLSDAIESKRKMKEELTSSIDEIVKGLDSTGTNTQPTTEKPAAKKEFDTKVKYKFVKGADPRDIASYNDLMAKAKTTEEKLAVQKKAFEFGLVEPR